MALINKNTISRAHVNVESETKEPDIELDNSDLTWWSYSTLGPQDYFDEPSNIKPYKKYEYSTPVWYNERKGGKKRKNRRF